MTYSEACTKYESVRGQGCGAVLMSDGTGGFVCRSPRTGHTGARYREFDANTWSPHGYIGEVVDGRVYSMRDQCATTERRCRCASCASEVAS